MGQVSQRLRCSSSLIRHFSSATAGVQVDAKLFSVPIPDDFFTSAPELQ